METAIPHLMQYGFPQMGAEWGWMGWAGIVSMILFALLLATVVFAFVRLVFVPVVEGTEGYTGETAERDTALATLRERFARGDIDEEEYERRRRVLTRE